MESEVNTADHVRAVARVMDSAAGEMWRAYLDIVGAMKAGTFFTNVEASADTRHRLAEDGFTVEPDEVEPERCWIHW